MGLVGPVGPVRPVEPVEPVCRFAGKVLFSNKKVISFDLLMD
jgi:hypothetical protein